MMDSAIVMQVIKTTILRRGNGTTTPVRIITQYWTLEGKLLCEVDPCPEYEGGKHNNVY